MLLLIFLDCIDRDLRGNVVRKMKLACADTAKRYAVQIVHHRNIKAGEVTAFEQLAITLREPAADNRTDGVDNKFARKIKGRCDFRLTCSFLVALLFHYLITSVTQLYA